ncbi:archaeosortase A [Methanosarcinaceae archaeon]|nr:archaeosortase A [Methanosarcinaceae archaeon]
MLSDLFLCGAALFLILMLAAGKKSAYGNMAGCAGWIIFAVYWLVLFPGYFSVGDYTNSLLVIVASVLCLIAAHAFFILFRKLFRKSMSSDASGSPDDNSEGTAVTGFGQTVREFSMLVVVICILYFPFRLIEPVGNALISSVTSETLAVLEFLGTGAVRTAFDSIELNGYGVRIILACTAIEAISVIAGLIIAARAPILRKAAALIICVPVVYGANICRNVFVILAYGNMWFGPDSFVIAHHYIAKLGSIIVLIITAVCLFRYIPGIMDMIMRIYDFYMGCFRAIAGKAGLIRNKK